VRAAVSRAPPAPPPPPRLASAIGHRIVHGRPAHRDPQPVTRRTLDELIALMPFVPSHLPDEIALIEAFERHEPSIPQIACFDTAFHHTMPDVARRVPIPSEYDVIRVCVEGVDAH
jgi:acetate kinase